MAAQRITFAKLCKILSEEGMNDVWTDDHGDGTDSSHMAELVEKGETTLYLGRGRYARVKLDITLT
jgi:hypothetical protein